MAGGPVFRYEAPASNAGISHEGENERCCKHVFKHHTEKGRWSQANTNQLGPACSMNSLIKCWHTCYQYDKREDGQSHPPDVLDL